MSRRRTSSDLRARARRLAARERIPYIAALDALRTARSGATRNGLDPGAPVTATGLPGLDRLLGTLQPGTLTVLAGRAGSGTTGLLLTIARHHARHGRRVLLAQLQSDLRETSRNLLAAESGQNLDVAADRTHDREAVAAAAARMRNWPVMLVDPQDSNAVRSLRAEALANGPGLLLVNTLALASPELPGQNAAELVALARELGVAAVAADHLAPGRHDDPPHLRDLRHRAILPHAHQFVLLHRPARTEPSPGRPDPVTLHTVLPNGTETGTTTALFEPHHHRMTTTQPEHRTPGTETGPPTDPATGPASR
ncbi:DnaB-like helicase C-terminal domain-containing protein [Streptomyces anulatus]